MIQVGKTEHLNLFQKPSPHHKKVQLLTAQLLFLKHQVLSTGCTWAHFTSKVCGSVTRFTNSFLACSSRNCEVQLHTFGGGTLWSPQGQTDLQSIPRCWFAVLVSLKVNCPKSITWQCFSPAPTRFTSNTQFREIKLSIVRLSVC